MDEIGDRHIDATVRLPVDPGVVDTGSGTEPIRLPYLGEPDTTGPNIGLHPVSRFNTIMHSAVIAACGALAVTAAVSGGILAYHVLDKPVQQKEAVAIPTTIPAQTTTTFDQATKSPATVPFYSEATPPSPTTTPTTLPPITTTMQPRPPIELPVIDVQKIRDDVAAAIERAKQSIVTLPNTTSSTSITTSTTLTNTASTTTSSTMRNR